MGLVLGISLLSGGDRLIIVIRILALGGAAGFILSRPNGDGSSGDQRPASRSLSLAQRTSTPSTTGSITRSSNFSHRRHR